MQVHKSIVGVQILRVLIQDFVFGGRTLSFSVGLTEDLFDVRRV